MSESASPPPEPPMILGYRRLHSTVALLRSRAADHEEAEIYLREEKRLARLLSKLTTGAQAATPAMVA